MTAPGRDHLRRLGAALIVANLLLPLGLIAYAALAGRDYAPLFWGERTAIAWFSSVQLLLIAGVAWANHETASLIRRVDPEDEPQRRWIWAVFAVGFVYLSIDERFGFHEFMRGSSS